MSANGEGSRTERRNVRSRTTSEVTPHALLCSNSGVTPLPSVYDATVGTGSNTTSTGRRAENIPPNSRNGLSIEDEEVAAATKAILSWPFFYGVQQLMHQATEFLDAKLSRKKPAARSPKTRKKGKTLDVNAASHLAALVSPVPANACSVPRRPRSTRRRVKNGGSVHGTGFDEDRFAYYFHILL